MEQDNLHLDLHQVYEYIPSVVRMVPSPTTTAALVLQMPQTNHPRLTDSSEYYAVVNEKKQSPVQHSISCVILHTF